VKTFNKLGIFAHIRARFLATSMTLSSRPEPLGRREQESWSYGSAVPIWQHPLKIDRRTPPGELDLERSARPRIALVPPARNVARTIEHVANIGPRVSAYLIRKISSAIRIASLSPSFSNADLVSGT
jgi:hypothetical protein